MTILLAGSVIIMGLFLAIVVMEPRACRMDEDACFNSRNIPRYLTGGASVLLAIVIVTTGMARHNS